MKTYRTVAERLSRIAHFGQKTRFGEDYINAHIIRVVNQVIEMYGASCAEHDLKRLVDIAWLHDVLEDRPDISYNDLRTFYVKNDFGQCVVNSVVILTRTSLETYSQYIDRIIKSESLDAIRVKIADLRVNLLVRSDGQKIPKSLMIRYRISVAKLHKALGDIVW